MLAIRASDGRSHAGRAAGLAGAMAGFNVGLRDLKTLAVPRTLLNQLLAHPIQTSRSLSRRATYACRWALPKRHPECRTCARPANVRRRLALLQKLLVYLAPSLLMAVTLASALLAAMGVFYALYLLGAWIVVDDLAPGWLTLSAMLSLTAFFLGVSIMGLSLGLQLLLTRANRDGFDGVASEVNRIDLFGAGCGGSERRSGARAP